MSEGEWECEWMNKWEWLCKWVEMWEYMSMRMRLYVNVVGGMFWVSVCGSVNEWGDKWVWVWVTVWGEGE